MNDRIKSLAWKSANGMLSYDAEGDWRLNGKEVERFAEMIVNQCIFELMYESTKQSNIMIQDFSVDVVNRIRQHFGVEE